MSLIHILTGDIGGTHTRLQLYDVTLEGEINLDDRKKFEDIVTGDQKDFSITIKTFLNTFLNEGERPLIGCLAVAGPIFNNTVYLTNRNITIDGNKIARDLGMQHFFLINDFAGNGYGLQFLQSKDVIQINTDPSAVVDPGKPIACLGAGTGLGEVYLTYDGDDYLVHSCEGSHGEFAAKNDFEWELSKYVGEQLNLSHVSTERLVSGLGLPLIYSFIADKSSESINQEWDSHFRDREEGGKHITTFGVIDGDSTVEKDPICKSAMEHFTSMYGSEAGNFALKIFAFGGLYVAGGIARNMGRSLFESHFLPSFLAKGRMTDLLRKIPIFVINTNFLGILGSLVYALKQLKKNDESHQALASLALSKMMNTSHRREQIAE